MRSMSFMRRIPRPGRYAAGTALVLALCAGTAAPQAAGGEGSRQQAPPVAVNRDARIMADFDVRVKAYGAMHRKLEATIAPLPKDATPEAIDAHQQALARLISRARARAKPGDLVDSETRALFRRHIAGVLASPAGPGIRATIMDEDPGRIRLSVNGRYPDSVPVTTVPPEILQVLPKLPEELEYRFISTQLILLDVHARTIADLIENALPRR
jgi:hypothetical protein